MFKKTLYTLNIDNYAPEITAITYPLLERYAEKIGANFHIIKERKFPDFPVVYEKLQIHELGKDNDWNIYIDSDAFIHPDLFDITEHISKDTVLHFGTDFANNRWRYDNYFRRDGRNIGSCNWFTVASNWCIDLWKPLDDLTLEEAVKNIYPTQIELNTVIKPSHLIDDYVVSRNIAKYGLKFKSFQQLLGEIGQKEASYAYHQYLFTEEDKLKQLKEIKEKWLNQTP